MTLHPWCHCSRLKVPFFKQMILKIVFILFHFLLLAKKDSNKKRHKRSVSDTEVLNLASTSSKLLDNVDQNSKLPRVSEEEGGQGSGEDPMLDIQPLTGVWTLPRPREGQSLFDYILAGMLKLDVKIL